MYRLYHITHISNLPSILSSNGLWCDRERNNHCPNAKNIAYEDLKGVRSTFPVHVGLKGTLADYVPFYFAPLSPMLCAIWKNLVKSYTDGQEKIVYLVTTCELVEANGLKFAFTDGHAIKKLTRQFDDLKDLTEIDWSLMKATYWADTDQDNDRKRRRQAEFLVQKFFPWNMIEEVGVFDNSRAVQVRCHLKQAVHPPVVVRRGWYY